MPKKPDLHASNPAGNKQFNLRLFIDYWKLNNRILTTRQIKANGKSGKKVANYPLPTIDNLLAWFKGCKYFSTLDLQSRYYHIKFTLQAAGKTAFVIDKGKWKFHLLPFGINLGPSAFSGVLGKVLAPCHKSELNYLDDIIIFSRTWEEHLEYLEGVFKQLKYADLKIKHSKCKFFKAKVHYLGYLVGVDGVQPLPDRLEAIKKLLAPTYVNELHQFLGITGFYRKLYLFTWISPTASPNYSEKELNSNGPNNAMMLSTPLWRNYAKCHLCNIQTLINLLSYSQMLSTIVILAFYIRHRMKTLIN